MSCNATNRYHHHDNYHDNNHKSNHYNYHDDYHRLTLNLDQFENKWRSC